MNNKDTTIKVNVNKNILYDKYEAAQKNRDYLASKNILCLNIMGSPGAGKTALLEMTAATMKNKISVIEGDLQTDRDAQRMREAGVNAYQITTGSACHLDAFMVEKAFGKMDLLDEQILFIENVGNLVCPASHDLGSHLSVVVLSVPEGDDKVGKYPVMFQKADLLILTKTDLIEYVPYNKVRVYDDFKKVNPGGRIIETSITDSSSILPWIEFVEKHKAELSCV
ncbi:MAG: hydrogenase nickel incorporation protein HypB [Leptospirales bacterium]